MHTWICEYRLIFPKYTNNSSSSVTQGLHNKTEISQLYRRTLSSITIDYRVNRQGRKHLSVLTGMAGVAIQSHSVCIYCGCQTEHDLNDHMIDRSVFVWMNGWSVHLSKNGCYKCVWGRLLNLLYPTSVCPHELTIKSSVSLSHFLPSTSFTL